MYDTRAARRPVLNYTLPGDPVPLKRFEIVRGSRQLIVADTHSHLYSMDLRQPGISGTFKGFSGAVTDLKIIDGPEPTVMTTGLDRFVRLHSLKNRSLLHQVYLKQQLSCILPINDSMEMSLKRNITDEVEVRDAEEDVWESLEVVMEGSVKTKKKR